MGVIAVVGGGPAGRTAAIRLAHAGQDVMLISRGGLGGQCLHHGCMVVCALNDVARLLSQCTSLRKMGILDAVPDVSFPRLLEEMSAVQRTIEGVLEEETRNAGVTIFDGKEAHIRGRELRVDGREQENDAILIATGSRPVIPVIEGITLANVITPHTLKSLNRLPEKIAIIGGGVIAAEYAYIFQNLGSEVTLLCRSEFLRGMKERISRTARKDLARVTIREQVAVERLEGSMRVESAVLRSDRGLETIETDAVMVATGLSPRTENISGLAKGSLGEIVVDAQMRTSVPGVFAAGDVTGPPYLTPVARHEGIVAADAILGKDVTIDRTYIPQSIKLQFEHAFCAGTNDESVSISVPSPAGPGSFWSVAERYTGMAALDFEPTEGKITGVYAAAPGSSLMVPYLAYLMKKGVSVHDLEGLMEVHPSTDGIYGIIRYTADWLRRGGIL